MWRRYDQSNVLSDPHNIDTPPHSSPSRASYRVFMIMNSKSVLRSDLVMLYWT